MTKLDSIMKEERDFFDLISDLDKKDYVLLIKAYDLAKKAHWNQKRQSGEDYITHPLGTAIILQKKYKSAILTAAGLLHDTVEDCPTISMRDIYQKFGKEIGFIVDSVTKTCLKLYGKKMIFENKIDKYLSGGMADVRVLLLKLADREHNLSDFDNLPPHKQIRMAFETQALFEPLKKILSYDKPVSIEETKKELIKFTKKNKISDYRKLEEYCYRKTFENFTSSMFKKVYSNFGKVIWEISDFNKFKSMCKNKDFKKSIQIISLSSDGNNFRGLFLFKSGHVISNMHKLSFAWLKK